MAELVLKNVDPSVVQKLEQRAKRLGSTVEAEAVRVLEAECMHRTTPMDRHTNGVIDADFDEPEKDASTAGPGSSPPLSPPSGEPDTGAPMERREALIDAYPDEYVVLLKERVIVHTTNKEEAYAHYDAAFDEAGDGEPIIVPPGALRRIGPPVIRGRALSAFGAGRQ